MKKSLIQFIFSALLFTCASKSIAQEGEKPVQDTDSSNQIYTMVEEKPDFPGGIKEFYNYISANFKVPQAFKGNGKIIAQFVVEKDGSLVDIKVLREVGFGTAAEAIRVLSQSPKWIPGKQKGIPVRVLYALPIAINTKK